MKHCINKYCALVYNEHKPPCDTCKYNVEESKMDMPKGFDEIFKGFGNVKK